jgi:hypothetical protein
MTTRAVRYDTECDKAAESLGGYEAIDDTLYVYLEALHREPKGFPIAECAWGSVRYIRTRSMGSIPELIWYFVIEASGDVLITNVEKYDPT